MSSESWTYTLRDDGALEISPHDIRTGIDLEHGHIVLMALDYDYADRLVITVGNAAQASELALQLWRAAKELES